MSYCYNNYSYETIKAGKAFKNAASLPVYHGKDLKVAVSSKNDTDVWLKSNVSSSNLVAKLSGDKKLYKDVEQEDESHLLPPLKKGQTVGELSVKVKGQDLYYLDGATSIKLKAKTDKAVDKANVFVIAWRAIKGVFNR